jgi:polyisoprenoid-binding protein YceI
MRRATLLLFFLVLAPPAARAADFLVQPGRENRVVFVSKASMEEFQGKTNKLEGRIAVRPDSVGDSITVRLEVDMGSLDTGIPLRNHHMRENHLETKQYPKAVFEGGRVIGPEGRPAGLAAGKPTPLDVEGTFTLHGVSRRIRIHITATYVPDHGGRIAFRTEFPVALADYQISRPQFLFLKLAETQLVRVNGVATATP